MSERRIKTQPIHVESSRSTVKRTNPFSPLATTILKGLVYGSTPSQVRDDLHLSPSNFRRTMDTVVDAVFAEFKLAEGQITREEAILVAKGLAKQRKIFDEKLEQPEESTHSNLP